MKMVMTQDGNRLVNLERMCSVGTERVDALRTAIEALSDDRHYYLGTYTNERVSEIMEELRCFAAFDCLSMRMPKD